MKKILPLLLLLLAPSLKAQTFEWLKTPPINLTMNPDMIAYATACDPSGNVYLTGYKGNAFPYNDILGDIYFDKYDTNGQLLFSKTFSGKAFAYNMVSDSEGNIIMALGFFDSITFDGTTLTETDQNMHYLLAKFDPSGSRIWHKQLSLAETGLEFVDDLKALTVDQSDNIYTGYSNFATSRIAKYSPDGNELLSIEQDNVVRVTSVGVDELGNIYAAGACADDLDATFAGVVAPSGLLYNTYVVKYSSAGAYQWAKFVDDVTCTEAHVVVHSSNEIYYCSHLFGAHTFGTIQTEGPVQSGSDFFLAKLNGEGEYQWVREVPGTGAMGLGRSNFVNLDASGNIYLAGFTDGTIDWGNGVQTPGGNRKSLLLKYAPDGTVFSAITAAGGYGRADGAALDADGNAFIAGMGFDSGNFGTIAYDSPNDEYYTYLTKISFATMGTGTPEPLIAMLYPNPAQNELYVSVTEIGAKGSIVNMLGQNMIYFEAAATPVDITSLGTGTYIVKIDGYKAVKFVKN